MIIKIIDSDLSHNHIIKINTQTYKNVQTYKNIIKCKIQKYYNYMIKMKES